MKMTIPYNITGKQRKQLAEDISFVVPPYCNYIGEFAFAGWTSSQTVYIPLGSKAEADSKYAFCWDMVNRNCDGQGPNLVFLSKPKE